MVARVNIQGYPGKEERCRTIMLKQSGWTIPPE
jgi:hypothetical protein